MDDFRKQYSLQEKSYIDEIRHLQTEYDNQIQILEELQSEVRIFVKNWISY